MHRITDVIVQVPYFIRKTAFVASYRYSSARAGGRLNRLR